KSNKVKFELRHHPARYTAQEVAAAEHITGEEVAKVVILKADERHVMCVLPATYVVDMEKAKKALGAGTVSLATEDEIAAIFPDCEVGAMPPFGTEYDLETFVDAQLAEDKEILIPAGTHEDSVLLAWEEYSRLARPTVADIGEHT
ncbi:MAG: YbaK/EbsC family protein, partial [Planctomycetota bacterium]|nr:YbaK/EbsC family protein [Planctomycetota bacterium]